MFPAKLTLHSVLFQNLRNVSSYPNRIFKCVISVSLQSHKDRLLQSTVIMAHSLKAFQ